MLLTKGIELRDGDEDQRRVRRRSSFRRMTALPRRAVASLTQWRSRDGGAVDEFERADDDDCRTLLNGQQVRFPRHATSLFFRQGHARRLQAEDDALF